MEAQEYTLSGDALHDLADRTRQTPYLSAAAKVYRRACAEAATVKRFAEMVSEDLDTNMQCILIPQCGIRSKRS